MKKILTTLMITSLVGCGVDPATQQKLQELEDKVAELDKKIAAQPPAAPGRGNAPPINKAEEDAANKILKEANQAFMKLDLDGTKAKLDELDKKYPNTRAKRASKRIRDELEVIGKEAGELEVDKWYQGEGASLADGKATMLVFWEVWCPHCKREVPKIDATFKKYKAQGLNVVGLTKQTRDIKDEQVASFIEENGVSYPIAKEKGQEMSKRFSIRGIPAAAVVKDGKVVWRGHPARVTDEMIEGWL